MRVIRFIQIICVALSLSGCVSSSPDKVEVLGSSVYFFGTAAQDRYQLVSLEQTKNGLRREKIHEVELSEIGVEAPPGATLLFRYKGKFNKRIPCIGIWSFRQGKLLRIREGNNQFERVSFYPRPWKDLSVEEEERWLGVQIKADKQKSKDDLSYLREARNWLNNNKNYISGDQCVAPKFNPPPIPSCNIYEEKKSAKKRCFEAYKLKVGCTVRFGIFSEEMKLCRQKIKDFYGVNYSNIISVLTDSFVEKPMLEELEWRLKNGGNLSQILQSIKVGALGAYRIAFCVQEQLQACENSHKVYRATLQNMKERVRRVFRTCKNYLYFVNNFESIQMSLKRDLVELQESLDRVKTKKSNILSTPENINLLRCES